MSIKIEYLVTIMWTN